MGMRDLEQTVKKIDQRLERVEQILPSLATKEELRSSIEAAVAPLATKEELWSSIEAAVAPLATREEVRAEAVETRRHFDVVAESLRDDIRLIAEGQVALHEKVDALRVEVKQDIARLDGRVTVLETSRRSRLR